MKIAGVDGVFALGWLVLAAYAALLLLVSAVSAAARAARSAQETIRAWRRPVPAAKEVAE